MRFLAIYSLFGMVLRIEIKLGMSFWILLWFISEESNPTLRFLCFLVFNFLTFLAIFEYKDPMSYELRLYDEYTQGPDLLMKPYNRTQMLKDISDDKMYLCIDEEYNLKKQMHQKEFEEVEKNIELMAEILKAKDKVKYHPKTHKLKFSHFQ